MKKIKIKADKPGFDVVAKTKHSEAATMVIAPGESEGGPENKHTADQWLYVLDGTGSATIDGHHVQLEPGVLLEIAAGEKHEIKNTGEQNLCTLNFYSAPIY